MIECMGHAAARKRCTRLQPIIFYHFKGILLRQGCHGFMRKGKGCRRRCDDLSLGLQRTNGLTSVSGFKPLIAEK